jgi:hypothetical protein
VIRRLVSLAVIAAVLVGADVAARGFVSATVSDRAQQEAPVGSSASASVGGFPFLPPLLLSGRVSHASVHVENIQTTAIVFAEVAVDLYDVQLDRGRLINDRKARITKIDHGTIRAVLTADALSNALHVPVKMDGGQITVTVAGTAVVVVPGVVHGRLTLSGPLGRSFSLTIPSSDYVPCVSAVVVEDAQLDLSCTIHEVPPALLDAVQRT